MTAPDCLDPQSCPVPDPDDVDLRRLRIARIDEGRVFHTAYHRAHWPELFNASDDRNARFSPLHTRDGIVPTLYGAMTQTVALLETAFHDLHSNDERLVSETLHLAPLGLVALTTPDALPLVDCTDAGLDRLTLSRSQLIGVSSEHYACTREWAAVLHERPIGDVQPAGVLWQSRVAELAQGDSPLLEDLLPMGSEVFVLFGDRVPTDPSVWAPGDPHYDDLTTGDGRLLAELIAEQLGAVIIPS